MYLIVRAAWLIETGELSELVVVVFVVLFEVLGDDESKFSDVDG